MKKAIRYLALGIPACFGIIVLGLILFFHEDFYTVNSIKQVNKYPMYYQDSEVDYNLPKLLSRGTTNDMDLVQFASKQILKGVPLSINVPKIGCTTFAVTTPNGKYLMGRNLDLPYSGSMVVRTAPKDGYKSLSMVNLMVLGQNQSSMNHFKSKVTTLAAPYIPFDGINEKGVSAAILCVPGKSTYQKTGKPGISTSTAIRLILDKAANTDQAVKLLKKYDMHASSGGCYHFQIDDANGQSEVVEWKNNKMQVVPQTGKYQLVTNFYKGKGKLYRKGFGKDRYRVANQALHKSHGVESNASAMDLLDKVHNGSDMPYKGKSATQWSVVYNTTDKTMTVCPGGKYQSKYHYRIK